MTEQDRKDVPTPDTAADPAATPAPDTAVAGAIAPTPPLPDVPGAAAPADEGESVIDQHPEILVGAAFLGGFLLAAILRRRAR